jgi:hypothetical protein
MAWTGHPSSNFVIFYSNRMLNGTWNSSSIVTTLGGINLDPALAQLNNNTLYLFWAYKAATSPHYQLEYVKQNGGSFSKIYKQVPLTSPTTLNDTLPSATVGKDGTLWLVWTRDNSTLAGTTPVMRQLWYKTLKNGVWSTEQPITLPNDVNWNYQPSVVVGRDGIVRVAYSRGVSSTTVFQIYYLTFNGSVWSSPTPITTQSTTQDANPSIMQDRNGTFWVFWARNVPQGTTNSAYLIYEVSSINNGASWTSETVLTTTSCSTSGCTDNEYPAAVQSTSDKYIWVFYATDPGATFNIYALQTTRTISPVHHVIVSYFSPNSTLQFAGGHFKAGSALPIYESAIIQILVVFQNIGDFNETVTLILKATNTTSITIGSQVFSVSPGASIPAYFNFNTTGVTPARYGLSGNASIAVEPVGNRPDSLLSTSNLIHLLPWGDVDWDGSDTITDVSVVFYNYGFTCLAPYNPSTCSSRYVAAQWGDINGNGIIDVVDASVAAHNYGILT